MECPDGLMYEWCYSTLTTESNLVSFNTVHYGLLVPGRVLCDDVGVIEGRHTHWGSSADCFFSSTVSNSS